MAYAGGRSSTGRGPHGYRFPDGTDISRMTVAAINAAQRKLSPKFPDLDEAHERRQKKHEQIIARILLGLCLAFGIASPFAVHPWWLAASATACFVGFVITCYVAGSRQTRRYGNSAE